VSRKNWSNLFFLTAVLIIWLAVMFRFPLRVYVGIASLALMLLAMRTRRRMV
jgi:hypothetical protein